MTRSVGFAAVLALGCNGDEPHACDEGTPTCQSSLVVKLAPGVVLTEFHLEVSDTEGLDVSLDCPEPEGGFEPVDGYTFTCGAGQLTIATNRFFGDEVTVRYEGSPEETFAPDWQKGGDFCGNPCTIGTIQL